MPSAKKRKKNTRPAASAKGKKKSKRASARPAEAQVNETLEPIKTDSLTAIVGKALRTGVSPVRGSRVSEVPGEDRTLRGGDPDVDPLENEFSGEEFPGATTPTPDQSNVDDIGRAYGLKEEDSGALRTSEELRSRRDRRRPELVPPKKPGQL